MNGILIAHRNPVRRDRLVRMIEAAPGRRLVASVPDLTAAYHVSEHVRPAIALIGEDLAALPEFEVMLLLFRALSIRCIIVTDLAGPGARPPLAGVEWMALDDVPLRLDGPAGTLARVAPPAPTRPAPTDAGFASDRLILIGASTGGVDALIRVLGTFPDTCPPTLVVQHTGGAFSSGLARLIDGHVAPQVAEARDGEVLKPGQIRLAPGSERHLTVASRGALVSRLEDGTAVSGHRPSVDALFRSAVPFAPRVVAAILTGMGRDGAAGLADLRRAGATTFGQDEGTSVVYGMPRVAHEMGGVGRQLPVTAIGGALLSACRRIPA